MFRSAHALLAPKSIAIVGASETGAAGWAKGIYENLEYGGFPVKLHLINPGRQELWGRKVHKGFADIGEPVDVAIMLIPAEAIPAVLAEGAEHGLKSAIIYAARFGEGGNAEGLARAKELKALCDGHGLRLAGPNCLGTLSIREKLLLYPTARVRGFSRGPLGVIFQSGGTFQFWLQQAHVRGLGFSYAISSGNELDLDLADYINFMVEDEGTRVIACMVEGVRRPAAFIAAAEKALSAGKPIMLVKIGRTEAGQVAAMSHTGALAGNDAVFDAVCEKTGIIRCASLDDMIEMSLVFSAGRIPRGARVAMAGSSGGSKGLFLDYAGDAHLELAIFGQETAEKIRPLIDLGTSPDNPLDTGAGVAMRPKQFADICRTICADPNVDLLAMSGQLPASPTEPGDPSVFSEVARSTDKPVLAFGRLAQNVGDEGRRFQIEAGMPFVQGMPQTVSALAALVRYGQAVRRGPLALPAVSGRKEDLDGPAFDRLLERHGLAKPKSLFAKTPGEAARLAATIGFPVAVKIVSPQALHKTEVGGVALDLRDGAAVSGAAEAMAAALRKHDAQAQIEGYLIQEMVSGLELIIGVRADPQFGPFMVVGLGGVFVEALKDIAIRLLPVDEQGAREMLASLKSRALLAAFRGKPARDVTAVAKAVAGLSQLFLAHRDWLTDLEINPLIALADGCGVRAVDVRAVRR